MADDGPEPNDPLWPYFRERVPTVPTGGRRWVALFLLFAVIGGTALALLGWLLRLL